MNTVIFRTAAPVIVAIMLVFSVFVLLRGHNQPGGGFIGGLIGAAAFAVYGMATSVGHVRRALRVHPITVAGFGLLLAGLSGFVAFPLEMPYLTGVWSGALSTPGLFDIGVYLVVLGTMTAAALALEEGGGD